jgi:hypothetical protein
MNTPPPGFMVIENIDHNDDGSVTVYASDFNGQPIVKTYAADETITIIRGER